MISPPAAHSATAEITLWAVMRCYTDGVLPDGEPVVCDLPDHGGKGDHYDATQQIRWLRTVEESEDE